MSDEYFDKINEEDLKKFYTEYKKYNKNNNVFDFEKKRKKIKPINVKISFDLRPSEEFIEKMEQRVYKVQKALDDLRTELYLYSTD